MSFARIRFQDAAVRMLRTAVAGDRLPHAYLFAGPRGVGKGLAARELAKLMLCRSPRGKGADDLDACDRCTTCERVDRGVHPDVYWFRKEPDRNDLRINLVVRGRGEDSGEVTVTVTESVRLHPMEASRTITVVDDAEYLNRAAANALLKVLEEPAPHAVLILLCADPSQLPGTILSRCQWVRFGPLPEEFVAEKLAEVLEVKAAARAARGKEEPVVPLSAEEAVFVCRFAGGSIEQAERLAGSGLWELKRDLLARLPHMDEAEALDMGEIIGRWAAGQVKSRHVTKEAREETAIKRESFRLALAAIASAYRDAAVLAAGAPDSVRLINLDQRSVIEELAAWPAEARIGAINLLADAQEQIARYVHTELAAENALLQAGRLRPAAKV